MTPREYMRHVLARLDRVQAIGRDRYLARCPLTDSHKLAARPLEVRLIEGEVVVKCHAHCSERDVLAALRLSSSSRHHTETLQIWD